MAKKTDEKSEWTMTSATWADGCSRVGYVQDAGPNAGPRVALEDLSGEWKPEDARALAALIVKCADLAEGKDPQEGGA